MARHLVFVLLVLLIHSSSLRGTFSDRFNLETTKSNFLAEQNYHFEYWNLDDMNVLGYTYELWDCTPREFESYGGNQVDYIYAPWPIQLYDPEMTSFRYLEKEELDDDWTIVSVDSKIERCRRDDNLNDEQWDSVHSFVSKVMDPSWFPYELKDIAQAWWRPADGHHIPIPVKPDVYVRYKSVGFRGLCFADFQEKTIWVVIHGDKVHNMQDFQNFCAKYVRVEVLNEGSFIDGDVTKALIID